MYSIQKSPSLSSIFDLGTDCIRSNQSAQISVSPGMGLEDAKISGMQKWNMSATEFKQFSDNSGSVVLVLKNYPQTAGMVGSKLDMLVRPESLDFT